MQSERKLLVYLQRQRDCHRTLSRHLPGIGDGVYLATDANRPRKAGLDLVGIRTTFLSDRTTTRVTIRMNRDADDPLTMPALGPRSAGRHSHTRKAKSSWPLSDVVNPGKSCPNWLLIVAVPRCGERWSRNAASFVVRAGGEATWIDVSRVDCGCVTARLLTAGRSGMARGQSRRNPSSSGTIGFCTRRAPDEGSGGAGSMPRESQFTTTGEADCGHGPE